MTADGWRLGHRPGLDQIRGVAVLAVVVAHTMYELPVEGAGAIGVGVFFTLSGFLITRLLIEESEGTGTVNVPHFYMRRARRLLPALPAAFVLCCAANVALGVDWRRPLTAAMTYSINFTTIDGSGGTFRHLWSLAIEEHFYLLWPAVVMVVPNRRMLTRLSVAVIVLVTVARSIEAMSDPEFAYRATWLRLDGMLAGGLLAMHLHRLRIPRWAPVAAWVLLGVLSVEVLPRPHLIGWGLTLCSAASVLAVAGAMDARQVPWLEWVGRVSYGIYLFHYPLAKWLVQHGVHGVQLLVCVLALSAAAAQLSYELIERRFRSRTSRPDAVDVSTADR